MSARVALCIDEMTCRNPQAIGLEGEPLETQPWLGLFASGEMAREAIRSDSAIEEAWVISCDDVEPINLAATLKADREDLTVRLVSFEGCGSLYSRAHTAHIDEVVDRPAFLRRYAAAKQRYAKPTLQGGKAVEQESPTISFAPATVTVPEPLFAPTFTATPPEAPSPVQLVSRATPVANTGRAFLLPIVSGSGGAGKSSVAVVGAHIARAMGHRTLLLDYDLQFGDAAIMAGVDDALAIDEAIAHPDRVMREAHRDPGLAVLAAPARLEAAEDIVHAMPPFLDELSDMFDVIIANTGAAWAEQHAVLLERCSAALFLIDQRASSVRACRHALELCARCGIASGPFQFAVNRCSKNAPLTSIDVSCALQGVPVYELKEGGRDVEDYLGGGAAAELLESRNEFCTSLEYVIGQLLPGGALLVENQVGVPEAKSATKRRGRRVGRKRGRNAS